MLKPFLNIRLYSLSNFEVTKQNKLILPNTENVGDKYNLD